MTKADYDIVNSFSYIADKWFSVKEDAEDVMQEVFLSILKNYASFEKLSENGKKNYTVRSIHNRVIDLHRRRTSYDEPVHKEEIKYYMEFSNVRSLQTEPDVYAKMELDEVLEKGKGNRMCDTLFMFAIGYKNNEIAQLKNQSLTTTLGQCRYARNFLRK